MITQEVKLGELDGPVVRLHKILSKARTVDGNTASTHVWADVLGVSRKDGVGLYLAVADFVRLVADAKKSIEQLEDVNRDLYLEPFVQIDRVVSQNLGQKWEPARQFLTETVMLALEMAARATLAQSGQKAVDEEALKTLQTELDDLIERVLDAEFSSQMLRHVLLEQLGRMRDAILAYRISGNAGLRRALEGMVGTLFVHGEELAKFGQRDNNKQTVMSLFHFVASISEILGFGVQAAQLAGFVPLLLGPG